jgi:hypothetical protein
MPEPAAGEPGDASRMSIDALPPFALMSPGSYMSTSTVCPAY